MSTSTAGLAGLSERLVAPPPASTTKSSIRRRTVTWMTSDGATSSPSGERSCTASITTGRVASSCLSGQTRCSASETTWPPAACPDSSPYISTLKSTSSMSNGRSVFSQSTKKNPTTSPSRRARPPLSPHTPRTTPPPSTRSRLTCVRTEPMALTRARPFLRLAATARRQVHIERLREKIPSKPMNHDAV